MHGQMPQEIEVWYTIPALRREIAKAMLEEKLTQKEIAKIMGITEAAVSQYLHSKRAKDVLFPKNIQASIKESAKKIIADPKQLMNEMMHLTRLEDTKQVTCKLHKKHDANLPMDCESCFETVEVK